MVDSKPRVGHLLPSTQGHPPRRNFALFDSVESKSMPNVAFLGPSGTFSHQVAYEYFGEGHTFQPKPSIANVFASLSSEIPFVCMPLANSTHGAVIETMDSFRSDRWSKDAFIRDESTLKIEHCLVVASPADGEEEESVADIFESIVCVYSHEQALGQCARWLGEHLPQARRVKMLSTAAAAERLVQRRHGDIPLVQSTVGREAAICSEMCLRTQNGLRLVQKGIQDRNDNQTRFIIVGHHPSTPLPIHKFPDRSLTRTLLRICPQKDRLGKVLSLLSTNKAPLTLAVQRIDCRPSLEGAGWSEVYFVELAHDSAPGLEKCVRDLLASLRLDSDALMLGAW